MDAHLQQHIIEELGVKPVIDPNIELFERVNFLAGYARAAQFRCYVLGISGGVDSTLAGWLAQQVATQLRTIGYDFKFVAVRLPYGTQQDEDMAQKALDFIKPDQVITVDIKPAVDAISNELDNLPNFWPADTAEYLRLRDFHKGNNKARQRMVVQYHIAGLMGGGVIGTDHASEALMGFFTKHGDGAADVLPLAGLEKEQVRLCCATAGAPPELFDKPATADLEDQRPGLLDEVAFNGVSYETIGAYLRGEIISDEAEEIILSFYYKTIHKRQPAATPNDDIIMFMPPLR